MLPDASLLEFRSTSQTRLLAAVFPSARLFCLYASLHSALTLPRCVPAVLISASAGISTCCPSATASALALGPDFPRADQLYSGNLGYSADRILTYLSLLIPAFSLRCSPRLLAGTASLSIQCSSTSRFRGSSASVVCFSPGNFRRRTSRPVSCYALFQCMAASEPTSWLSSKSHILYHLTHTWGP